MNHMIKVNNVSFSYHKRPLFANISFDVNPGDFVALIGSNGAGKSTLMKLLLGELDLQQGSICVLGTPVHKMKNWQQIGYVSQKNILVNGGFPATVQEVVQANLYSQIGFLRFPNKSHYYKVHKALEMVGMEDNYDQLIGNLSGGQQQRVMIARALVNDPVLLLLDEPTTGIDSVTTEVLYNLLQGYNQNLGMTIMMVTHDIRKSAQYATRTLCLEEGSLVELNKHSSLTELKGCSKETNYGDI